MYIRRDQAGRLLLLICRSEKGKFALGNGPCEMPDAHILIRTDNFQHPSCIEFKIEGRGYSSASFDSNSYSAAYKVDPGAGKFIVKIRWQSGHSPYPEISDMKVWCFGVFFDSRKYPKADSYSDKNYATVAIVEVSEIGEVKVNGKYTGIWRDLIVVNKDDSNAKH